MSHDYNVRRLVNSLAESVRHNSCLNLCALLHLAGFRTVKLIRRGRLDNYLIAASAQSHLKGKARHLVALVKSFPSVACSDT